MQFVMATNNLKKRDEMERILKELGIEVLTAKQHLQFGILHMAADGAQAFPGIFIQEAKAGVKRSTAPCFECVEAAII